MDIFGYTDKRAADVLQEFSVDPQRGLSPKRAKKLLGDYGKNQVASTAVHWWEIFFRQFKSPFIYLLFGAAFLAFVLGEKFNGLMILLFLAINAGLGFYQEYHSEKTIQLLKKYIISYTKVIRGGKEIAISSEEIVPGDILVLETGDKITADVRFIEAYDLMVDESILTGESVAVKKNSDSLKEKIKEYYEAVNLGFSGTTVIKGNARALVLATGRQTSIGKISHLTFTTKHVSGFEKGVAKFSSFILRLILITLVFVFLVNIFIKGGGVSWIEFALFSIALAVSVIPEALPLVTTFSLSRGAHRLAQQKVIVKRLSSIEDLGGIEILCTDKTGTLTENSLTVAEIYSNVSEETILYANLAAAPIEGKKLEPFDAALEKKINIKEKQALGQYRQLLDISFDPKIRRNGVVVKKGKNLELITRGAPEVIIGLCSNIQSGDKKTMNQWISNEGSLGRRVLAVAKKNLEKSASDIKNLDFERETSGFAFLGIISFADPVKPSAYEAVRQAVELGVKIKIITGDSKEVAGAVAHQIGLVKKPTEVITAEELENFSYAKKAKAMEDYAVFARVSPEEKYQIINSLQKKYEIGFLGEGINDAPALKIAGVSIVVDGASDIARETADIILLKKSLKVILDGIKEGRQVFANTTKYIKITLISNFGNFFAVAIASFLIDFLPMLPLQILLLNLLSDFPMIAISADNVDRDELVAPKRYNVRDIVLLSVVLGAVSTVFDFIFFGLFYRISPGVLQTNWFIGSILTELILIFSIRTKKFFFKSYRPSFILSGLSFAAVAVTIFLPFTLFGQKVFNFVKPSLHHLYLILIIVVIYFICTEIIKLIYFKALNHSTTKNNLNH